ncbi:unnamed protein product [Chironomus riparius]|uniref:Uncharacterized protein n=1 Tax=Chironomus riparius TaxID=315576 RepID=A0A9N9WJI5_9DIPT|nr:unnamed protein product [Chironomus riparius]
MKKLDKFLCLDLKTGVQAIGFYRTVFYGVLSVIILDLFVEPPKELCGKAKNANRQGSTFSNQHCDLLTTLLVVSFIYSIIYCLVHFVVLIGIYKRNHKLILLAIIAQGIEFLVLVPAHLLIIFILSIQGLIIFTLINIAVFCTDYYTLNAFHSLYQRFELKSKERKQKIEIVSLNSFGDNKQTLTDI